MRQLTRKVITTIFTFCAVFAIATAAQAATLTVTNTNDSGAGSLRDRITAAAGDTIVFDPTVFASAQTINTSSALAISKNLMRHE